MQLSNITLLNAATESVDFTPLHNVNKTVLFQEDDITKVVGMRATASTNTRVGSATVSRRVSHKLRIPVSVPGSDGIAEIRFNEIRITEIYEPDSPVQDVDDLRAFALAYMASPLVTDAAKNGRHPF